MAELKNVCVYCGSAKGRNPAYLRAARALGTALAREKIRLVYGGGGVGMMGEVARAAEDAGGKVLGIIPDFLVAREHAAQGARNRHGTRHARTQAHDVRARRRLRSAAGRNRHARGTRRTARLGAARPPQEAGTGGERARLLG